MHTHTHIFNIQAMDGESLKIQTVGKCLDDQGFITPDHSNKLIQFVTTVFLFKPFTMLPSYYFIP